MSKIALKSLEEKVSDSFFHRNDLLCSTSQYDVPETERGHVSFVYLSGDNLYTARDKTLYVYYLASDTPFPIATYTLSDWCRSGVIINNRLYLGAGKYL